jgi:hypothetical protein
MDRLCVCGFKPIVGERYAGELTVAVGDEPYIYRGHFEFLDDDTFDCSRQIEILENNLNTEVNRFDFSAFCPNCRDIL